MNINPELMKYFKDSSDAEKIRPYSHKYVEFKCPLCGYEEMRKMCDISRRGFKCKICYGGFSFPSRMVGAVLNMSSVKFESEKTFKWSKRYRYDFYLKEHNAVIEVNGLQHYKKTGFSKDINKVFCIDAEKRGMAKSQGLDYIVVDARQSDPEYLKLSICKSGLQKYVDMQSINWDIVHKMCETDIGKRVLDMWNAETEITEIANTLYISKDTVRKYIKIYNDANQCRYNPRERRLIGSASAWKLNKKPIRCITTGRMFKSINDASDYYGISAKAISNCLCGRSKSTYDCERNRLEWEYVFNNNKKGGNNNGI